MSSPIAADPSSLPAAGRLVGLRLDACTFDGVRQGIPPLLDALARRGIRATLFPALGPDRSGLAVFRLFTKRGFLSKMLRTGGARMYGLRTALRGTLLPAPVIADRCGAALRRALAEGHEVGLHGWDHVRWQDRLDRLAPEAVREDYSRAAAAYRRLLGAAPPATAAPAWLASPASLEAALDFSFRYASDCRGRGPFLPVVGDMVLSVPQVPVTLPTLDEVLGRDGQDERDFNDLILASLRPGAPNVHTAHAEAEGRRWLPAFESLLDRAIAAGWTFLPLGELLARVEGELPRCPIARSTVLGRAGEVSVQGKRGPRGPVTQPGERSSHPVVPRGIRIGGPRS